MYTRLLNHQQHITYTKSVVTGKSSIFTDGHWKRWKRVKLTVGIRMWMWRWMWIAIGHPPVREGVAALPYTEFFRFRVGS